MEQALAQERKHLEATLQGLRSACLVSVFLFPEGIIFFNNIPLDNLESGRLQIELLVGAELESNLAYLPQLNKSSECLLELIVL